MSPPKSVFEQYEDRIENALWSYEVKEHLGKALNEYRAVETDLAALSISSDQAAYPEYQRVLAYCLMRQDNILRQMGETEEALDLGEREIAAARASGDELTLARSLMSNGTSLIVGGEIEEGLSLVDESRSLFEAGDSDDFTQGLGWYWILQADLANGGLIDRGSLEIVHFADQALGYLLPIENWTGAARAYAARAEANKQLGDESAAAADHQTQQQYEGMAAPSESSPA